MTKDIIDALERTRAEKERINQENLAMQKKQGDYMLKQWKPVTADGKPFRFGESYFYWMNGAVRDIVPEYSALAISRHINGELIYKHFGIRTSGLETVSIPITRLFTTHKGVIRDKVLNRANNLLDELEKTRQHLSKSVVEQTQHLQLLTAQVEEIKDIVQDCTEKTK